MPNHLADEKSPYLLQHVDNPVDWYPWGQEALAKAKAEDKPIFLSVGYATCHWCHVMAHESFEDEEVAELLNREYVAVKVDREERPDLDELYMGVCQALTGHGGWPLSVFLTPDAKPFYAGTYFPKQTAMGRPGFMEVLGELAKRWRSPERERMINAGEEITKALKPAPAPGELNEKTLGQAARLMAGNFDARHGGFGNAPKFPSPHQFLFLLRRHLAQPESAALEMVEATLDAMRDGGIFDQIGYGFHRYSTDAQWLAPHFEKMLYDQALLAMAYLEAGQLTGKQEYSRTAEQVFEYVLGEMTHPGGGFFSAEDADSEGVEGLFYVWKPEQVAGVLGAEAAELFCSFYGIVEGGNFEHGWSIAHRNQGVEAFAASLGRTAEEVADELERSRVALLAARSKRVRPLLDDKVLTAWNGLMIAALAMGHRVLGKGEYLQAASRAADFVLAEMTDGEGRLMRRWRDGHVKGVGFLEDYAFMIWGLTELYLAGFDPARLDSALDLTRLALELFEDPEHGGLFFTPSHGEELIIRNKDIYDGAVPSGNSTMAYNLLRLARLTGDSGLEKEAQRIMNGMGGKVERHPPAFTMMLCALEFALAPGREVVLAGEPDDGALMRMLATVRRRFAPFEVVLLRPGGEAGERVGDLAPFTKEMIPPDEGARAYVCTGHACQSPVESSAALAGLLEESR